MYKKIIDFIRGLFFYREEFVYQNGVDIYILCLLRETGTIISTLLIQFIPIWILFILSYCFDVRFKLNSFLENVLVFDIVSSGGYLIETRKGKSGEKNKHIKLLSVLVVSLASVAYCGLLLSRDSIGVPGLTYISDAYISVTIGITQFSVLIQYLWLKKKD